MSFIKTETMKLLRHTIQYKLNIYKTTKNLPAKSLTRQQLMLYEKLSYESPLWKPPSHKESYANISECLGSKFKSLWTLSSRTLTSRWATFVQFWNLPNCHKAQILAQVSYIWCMCVFALLQYDHVPFAFIALMCARWSSLLNA